MAVSRSTVVLAAAVAMAAAGPALAERPVTVPDGTVSVRAFDLPPSILMSREALDLLKQRGAKPMRAALGGGIAEMRAATEAMLAPSLQTMQARHPVDIAQQTMGGVPVRIITPKGGGTDPGRVLINVHGGAFTVCATACALLESLPIASAGGFKVVSVDYRQGPEAKYPAATEDIATVYRELLKTYRPKQIGIFGCSAGGVLSAQAAAWLPAHGLPQVGAIGVFGAGGVPFGVGDSAHISGAVDGTFPAPKPGEVSPAMASAYFDGADLWDPMISPARSLEVLARFPPTLVITGTRAMDLSPAVHTHSQLIKAGVSSQLIVGEGLGHCYIYNAQLPEAQDAYDAIVAFFRKTLG